MMSTRPRALVLALLAALALASSAIAQPTKKPPPNLHPRSTVVAPATAAKRWKINTHLFAANIALRDAMNDSMVTIPPFGEFPVAAAAISVLKHPATYRAGVLGPDLFPEMYTGGWSIHSDFSQSHGWIADNWMRHVWSRARAWPKAEERDRVMAFAYGFLTHAAGDMFAHTYVSRKTDGAWVTGIPATGIKHIVLEGYIGSRTPPTDVTMDVWPRFVAEVLIKDPAVREHTPNLKHYQTWLKIHDWLGPRIEKAKNQMNNSVGDDAPYWAKCLANPVPCAKKEQMESWRLDIDRGLRALVDSSQTLGEKMMAHEMTEGVGAMTGWASEWVPKMFGAHAIGEGSAAMAQFMDWVNEPLEPYTQALRADVMKFLERQFPTYYQLYESVKDPSYQMDHVDELGVEGFPAGTKETVTQDMHIQPGPDSLLNWREFEPLYNSVILSKLALLDGDGLNELVKRAGVTGQLFPPGPATNILLGVVRSLTQSYQWVGEKVDYKADTIGPTKYGICGPEHVLKLPDTATVCGIKQRTYSSGGKGTAEMTAEPADLTSNEPVGGFALWGHPEAREKIFRVIFKGYGPGPGQTIPADAVDVGPPARGLGPASSAVRVIAEQIDRMRELLVVMKGKISGVIPSPAAAATSVPAQPAVRPGAIRVPGRAAPARPPTTKDAPPTTIEAVKVERITNWGERCCAKDIAELQAALALIQSASEKLRDRGVFSQLGRPPMDQISERANELGRAIDTFANTADARSAASALERVAAGIEALARPSR